MIVSHREIARRLGVSRATVSNALNRKGRMAEDVRERIQKAAYEMGYRPNRLVEAIQSGASKTVGVFLGAPAGFFGQIAAGCNSVLIDSGYIPMSVTKTERVGLGELLFDLLDRRVDGVIAGPSFDADSCRILQEFSDREIPVVLVDTLWESRSDNDFVGSDDEAGGRLVADHLLELGHRNVLVCKPWASSRTGKIDPTATRCGAMAARFANAGGTRCEVIHPPRDMSGVADAIEAQRPTAIFVHDRFALALYDLLAERGLRIPADVSVIGYANLDVAGHLRPGLTSVDQHPGEMGRRAAEILIRRMKGKGKDNAAVAKRLLPELVVRQSTTAPTSQESAK